MTEESVVNIATLEQAKLVANRLKRNKTELATVSATLDIKIERHAALIKSRNALDGDIALLATQIGEFSDRKSALVVWLAKNGEYQEDADKIEAIATKIKALQARMAKEMRALRDLEIEQQMEMNKSGTKK